MAEMKLAPGWQLIASWDANVRGCWQLRIWPRICRWALDHGGDDDTWRYEVWLLDGPMARILRYARDDHGRRYVAPADGEIAQQPVKVIALKELPPDELRVSADQWPAEWRYPPAVMAAWL